MASLLDGLMGTFKKPRVTPTKSIGAPGTAVFSGFVEVREKNKDLVGRAKYRTYSEILANTSIVAAGVRYFLNLVSKADWDVQPVDDSEQAEEFAEMMKVIMHDMTTPWHRVVRRAAMYRFYGFSTQEWTAKRNEDGTIGMRDIEPRAQETIERWDTDESGTVLGVIQRSPQFHNEIYLPRGKLIYIVDDTINDSPEGLGLLRHVVEASKTLARLTQLETFGYETNLVGVPVGRIPYGELQGAVDAGKITEAEKALLQAPIENFVSGHVKNPSLGTLGIVLDSLTYQSQDEAGTPSQVHKWDLDILKSDTASSQTAIAAAIERLNQEIARVLGVEGLLLGSAKQGSQALSVDKSHNFALIIDSTLDELKESFEKDFMQVIWDLNGWPPEMMPTFTVEASQFRDVQKITGALKDMATAGAVLAMNDPAINQVRNLLGLADQPEVDDMMLSLLDGGMGELGIPKPPPEADANGNIPGEDKGTDNGAGSGN